jgi:hypothetical protein
MRGVLDLIDNVLHDISLSVDAMRWAPDSVLDLRIRIHREWPAKRQATWRWWCETCRQPLPQPHWWVNGVPDGGVVLSSGMRAFHQTIDPRTPRHAIVERATLSAGHGEFHP